jgi:hypothetical protein
MEKLEKQEMLDCIKHEKQRPISLASTSFNKNGLVMRLTFSLDTEYYTLLERNSRTNNINELEHTKDIDVAIEAFNKLI